MDKFDIKEVDKKKLDICHFRVPVLLTKDENNNTIATFKEVDHKGLCFKIETEEFETAIQAQALAEKMNQRNKQTLKLAKTTKEDGDKITRLILCDHGAVTINTNINK